MNKQTLFKWTSKDKRWGDTYIDIADEEWIELWCSGGCGDDDGFRIHGAENIAEVKRRLDNRVAPNLGGPHGTELLVEGLTLEGEWLSKQVAASQKDALAE